MSNNPPRDNASDSGDSAIAELEAAIQADPGLRGKTPPPQHGEWEDFERLLAENPELGQPVSSTKPATAFYYSKDRWDCGHIGDPVKTAIEREPADGEKNGLDPTTGQIHEAALLTNEIRGICPKCMAKWTNVGANDDDGPDMGGSSRDPTGPPGYDTAPSPPRGRGNDYDSDRDSLDRNVRGLDIDDGPSKGKDTLGAPPRGPPPAFDDDFSDRESISPPRSPVGAPLQGNAPPYWGDQYEYQSRGPPPVPYGTAGTPQEGTFHPPRPQGGPPPGHNTGATDDFSDDDDYDAPPGYRK